MMSDPTTVDRATIDRETGKVVLIIQEDRPWNDPETMHRELRSKVKRYVRYIRSDEFASEYGREPGETLIRLVCSDPPDDATMDFLGRVRYELGKLGIGFDHRVEWFSDETAGEGPLTVEGWEARTRFGRAFDDSEPERAAEPEEAAPEVGRAPGVQQAPEASHEVDAGTAEPETARADVVPEPGDVDGDVEAPEPGPTEPEASRSDPPRATESETADTSEGSSGPEGDLDVPAPPEGFEPSERERPRETLPDEVEPGLDPLEPMSGDAGSDEFAPDEFAPTDELTEFTSMMGGSRASPDMFDDIDHELIEEPGIEEESRIEEGPGIPAPEGLETGPPEPVPEAEGLELDRPDISSNSPFEPATPPPGDRQEGPDRAWPAEEFGEIGPGHPGSAGSEPGEAEIEILAGEDEGEEIWEELSAVGNREAAAGGRGTAAHVAMEAEDEEAAPSVGRALGAALSTAVAFAIAWGLLAVAAGQAAGPVALPLGLAVGFRVRLRGAGRSFGFRLIGGLGALLGCALGSLLATVGLLTVSEGLNVTALWERFAGARTALEALGGFYGLTDLGIYAIAILLSFWVSAARKSE